MKSKRIFAFGTTILFLGFSIHFTFVSQICVCRIETEEPQIALTFDDGPHPPFTEQILKILEKQNVKATFFLIGKNIEMHPLTARAVLKEGHEIGNHTYSHPRLRFRTPNVITEQIEKGEQTISRYLGIHNPLFRAPYGDFPPQLLMLLSVKQMKNILFDVTSFPADYTRPDPELIVSSILRKVRKGSIIALHDGEGTNAETVMALEPLISQLLARGYRFVTVSRMIESRWKS